MLPRMQRLTRPSEFAAVAQGGRLWRSQLVMVRALPQDGDRTRLGFAVSARIGKATVRNRVKRRLREILRHAPVKPGWDVVISPRQEAARVDFQELRRTLFGLLQRAGLLDPAELPVPQGKE